MLEDIPYSFTIVGIVICGLAGIVMAWALIKSLSWFAHKNSTRLARLIRRDLSAPIFLLSPLVCIYTAAQVLYPPALDDAIVSALTKIVFVMISVWLLIRVNNIICALLKRRFDRNGPDDIRARAVHTQIDVIRRLVFFLLIVLGFASFFLLFDSLRSIGVSIVASAGVAGIILGFAAQKTLGNLLAGFQIAITQPIRIEDVVIVENEWGWIEDITLTYVVVRIWDWRRMVLPISYFIEQPFQNWTRNSYNIIGSLHLFTDYTMPVQILREKIIELTHANRRWDGQVAVLQLIDLKETSMELRVLVSARNAPDSWDLRCELREGIIDFIQRDYPQCLPKTRATFEQENLRDIHN